MMKTAVHLQIHAERNKVVVNLMMSVEVAIWFAQVAQLVVDHHLTHHPEKNVVTLRVTKIRYYTIEYVGVYYDNTYGHEHIFCLLTTIFFIFIFGLECCETITLSSTNPSFTSNQAFGIGTYKKVGTDSRDRIMYRNSDYTFGDFILFYEGPNEGGRENWLVGTYPLTYCIWYGGLL